MTHASTEDGSTYDKHASWMQLIPCRNTTEQSETISAQKAVLFYLSIRVPSFLDEFYNTRMWTRNKLKSKGETPYKHLFVKTRTFKT